MVTQKDHVLHVHDGQLFAREWHGPSLERVPILLFHDSIGSVGLWRDFPAHLAERTRRRVIAYDRLGFGKSDPRDSPLSLDFIAKEGRSAPELLGRAIGFGDFVACGHSVGGAMAVEAAAAFPRRCRALVTLGAQAFVEDCTLEALRCAQAAFAAEGIARLKKYHGEKAKTVIESWTARWLSPEFKDWNLDAALSCLRCPVLVIHGGRDEYGSVQHPQRIAAERSQPIILEGVGHFLHREEPNTVLAIIERFLGEALSAEG